MNVQKIGSTSAEIYKQTISSTLSRKRLAAMAKTIMDEPVPLHKKIADYFLNVRIKSLEKKMKKNINNVENYVKFQHKKMKLKIKLSSTRKNIAKSIYEAFSK